MGSYADDRNQCFVWAVMPEDTPSRRSVVFDVAFPDFFPSASGHFAKLVRIQARVSRISRELSKALLNSFQLDKVLGVFVQFQRLELIFGFGRKP